MIFKSSWPSAPVVLIAPVVWIVNTFSWLSLFLRFAPLYRLLPVLKFVVGFYFVSLFLGIFSGFDGGYSFGSR